MFTLYAIQANDGLYVSLNPRDEYVYTGDRMKDVKQYLFDGQSGEETFHNMWVRLPGIPSRMSHMEQPATVYGDFRLIDESMVSDKIPLELTADQVGYRYSYNDGPYWENAAYKHLESLYNRIKTVPPKQEVDDEFELVILATIERVITPERFAYSVQKTNWRHEGLITIDNSNVIKQTLDRVLFPSLLMPEQPSALTSEQVYKIIQQHIREHLNTEAAAITSDYEFCFEVRKVIKLKTAQHSHYTSGTGRRARQVPITIKTRQVTCFEMTYSPRNYQGHTPIPPMVAESETALKKKMDTYLAALMEYINDPWAECPYCDWAGIIRNVDIKKPVFPK